MINANLNKYMYEFIEEICKEIGPRESGTEQERRAGDMIEEELKKYCDQTHQEEYISSPHAFLGGIRYGALMGLVSIILFWLSLLVDLRILQIANLYSLVFNIIAVILIIVAFCYFILEVMKYHETFDFLFPKKKSKNIIGVINPSENIKNTIIFSAHHDSAFEFNTFYYLKRFGQIIINIGYIYIAIVFIIIIIKIIFYVLSIELAILFLSFGIFFILFSPLTLIYMFLHTYHPVLGAFDNLSGVVVLLGIGKILSENKDNSEIFPQNTKIYLISFAGEEAGLRGSKRYVKAHNNQLKEEGTVVVNIDSIAKKEIVIIHDREPGIGVKHDPNIYQPLLKIAKKVNPNAKISPLAFGATDGATFSQKGIPATSIGGLNLKDELPPYYHTRLDTPENVEKEALGQFVEICLEFLKYIDSQ